MSKSKHLTILVLLEIILHPGVDWREAVIACRVSGISSSVVGFSDEHCPGEFPGVVGFQDKRCPSFSGKLILCFNSFENMLRTAVLWEFSEIFSESPKLFQLWRFQTRAAEMNGAEKLATILQ